MITRSKQECRVGINHTSLWAWLRQTRDPGGLAHDKVAAKYERCHAVEIYNPVEQSRLRDKLALAISQVRTADIPQTALDFGCGTGNLTRHLLELGLQVTAGDVSPQLIDSVRKNLSGNGQLDTFALNGSDLKGIPDGHFDLAATYSVLHHVPDYLAAIVEMVRVLKRGGVIYLDHEVNESYWHPSESYQELLRQAPARRHWSQFLRPSSYYNRVRRLLNPRFQAEGDIHVFPDDHIEWEVVERVIDEHGCEIVLREDYLLCRSHYPKEIYDAFSARCSDMRLLIARKC